MQGYSYNTATSYQRKTLNQSLHHASHFNLSGTIAAMKILTKLIALFVGVYTQIPAFHGAVLS